MDKVLTPNQQAVYDKLSKTIKNVKGVPTEVPEATAANFLLIFKEDESFSDVRFNILSNRPERTSGGETREWTSVDDSAARRYMEEIYSIANTTKWQDALIEFQSTREYHPVRDIINPVEWDGIKRVETFLIDWMKAEDTPYNREASRLLFAGGINRIYNPGCKFDSVITFIGKQGCGKSTICQWMALQPKFYNSVKKMKGKEGYEALQGVWIAEIEELLAAMSTSHTTANKEEEVKAFITTTDDYYRAPYTKRATHNKRQCIFLGTTNKEHFLTDKTGNRRWFPVKVHSDANNLYEHQDECMEDILQAWAEMKYHYDNGDEFARPVPSKVLTDVIEKERASAEVDDYRVGIIESYLKGKDSVCCIQVWKEALCGFEGSSARMGRKESNELVQILVNQLGWERGGVKDFGSIYKKQKSFNRPNSTDAA